MSELLTLPPPPDAIMAMSAIPGMSITPSILAVQRGPDGHLGPEAAGAILLLQATFADAERAAGFWAAAVPLMALLADAPGFIRRVSFPDGPTINLLAFWRTIEDAKAFASSPPHRAAVRDLYRQRWQYSHFSALWEIASNHGRQIFCTECDAVTPATEATCSGCGVTLLDPFRVDATPSA
jgi:heme-degrading monooxygenase HmoA